MNEESVWLNKLDYYEAEVSAQLQNLANQKKTDNENTDYDIRLVVVVSDSAIQYSEKVNFCKFL